VKTGQRVDEILGSFLKIQPPDRTDHTHPGGNAQKPARLRLVREFWGKTAAYSHADGTHTFGRRDPPDDGFGRDGWSDGQEGIGELPE
jgi:hypothetical protein